jgi:hypothetical protein
MKRKIGQAELMMICMGGALSGQRHIPTGCFVGYQHDDKELPESVRERPVPSWAWEGRYVRLGVKPYLRRIGRNVYVRENTGEIFIDGDENEPLYAPS